MKKRLWLRRLAAAALLIVLACVGFVWWCLPGKHKPACDTDLPVRYIQDLIYAAPITREDAELKLLTDTGGGLRQAFRPYAFRVVRPEIYPPAGLSCRGLDSRSDRWREMDAHRGH